MALSQLADNSVVHRAFHIPSLLSSQRRQYANEADVIVLVLKLRHLRPY